ncbi:MAG: DNRLRE domain-containing protein, partial [Alphaproteobacteria bacterium]|nr:DNRLRE domain-containing protein [Alphaproteobacteria bacterium]
DTDADTDPGTTTVVLNAVHDNTLFEDGVSSNGAGPRLFVGRTNEGTAYLRRGLVAFDVSGIPSNATVVAATLDLVPVAGTGPTSIGVHLAVTDWGEGTSDSSGTQGGGQGAAATAGDATWPCAMADGAGLCTTSWTTAGGDYVGTPTATASVDAAASFTGLTADVQAWIGGTANFGWVLVGDEATAGSAMGFSTREGASAPTLTVEYSTP